MKKLNSIFVILVISMILGSCGASALKSETEEAVEKQAENETPEKEQSWEEFFPEFKAAVASGDLEKVNALTDFRSIKADGYDDNMEFYFNEENRKKFAAAKASDAKAEPDMKFAGDIKVKDVMKLSFEEIYKNEDGSETGSAIYYFFSKIDGKYKLISIMTAG